MHVRYAIVYLALVITPTCITQGIPYPCMHKCFTLRVREVEWYLFANLQCKSKITWYHSASVNATATEITVALFPTMYIQCDTANISCLHWYMATINSVSIWLWLAFQKQASLNAVLSREIVTYDLMNYVANCIMFLSPDSCVHKSQLYKWYLNKKAVLGVLCL